MKKKRSSAKVPPESNRQFSRRAVLSHGQPISQLMSHALANPELISLAAGFVDQQSLPCEATAEAFREICANPETLRQALQYGTTSGYMPLREAILDRFSDQDSLGDLAGLDTDRVVLTAGSNQLLHLVAETLLDPGDIVLCSSPTYFVFMGTLRNLGVQTEGIETDEAGMIPEALEDRLTHWQREGQLSRIKAIYLVSYFDNPRGVSLAVTRRQQIVEICHRFSVHHHIYLLDDMAYRELRYEGEDSPSLIHYDPTTKHVIAAGTFSKSYSPGVRVGWGILPADLVEPVCNQKGNIDFGSPNLNQHLMHHVLQVGLLDAHIERIRAAYRVKRDAMLRAADKWLAPLSDVTWVRPQGGLYVWLELPQEVDAGLESRLFERAVKEGVIYVPGEYCFPETGISVRSNTVRLSFGVQTPDRIEQGVQALAKAIAETIQEV
ncbi:MAG: PLP-dependent aminotransferase family protein [Planctomycetaceae bacterium]|nr:PLP-dependent aminotransferase family protein [Planctomycetaceae bacterium]